MGLELVWAWMRAGLARAKAVVAAKARRLMLAMVVSPARFGPLLAVGCGQARR